MFVRSYLGFVAGEISPVVSVAHVGRRPTPRLAVPGPQARLGAHHRGIVDLDVRLADGTQVVARRELNPQRMSEVLRKPRHVSGQ